MNELVQSEVIIIGAGPAGSTTAIFLARQSIPSLVIEKEEFPRFHIGESMTGECGNIARELGFENLMSEKNFPVKHGVRVFGPEDKNSFWVPVMGRDDNDELYSASTWQVRRSVFDELVKDQARKLGVQFISDQALEALRDRDGRVLGLRYRDSDGRIQEIRSKILVDASGLNTFLSASGLSSPKERGLYDRQVALFTHVKGALRDPGKGSGNTLIFYQQKNHWAWFIPLDDQVTSIGVTVPTDYFRSKKLERMDFLQQELLDLHPNLAERVQDIELVEEVRGISNYSYQVHDFAGPGFICVGDSHRFIDPIFSFGLHFAMSEARFAARAIEDALAGREEAAFSEYQSKVDIGQDQIQILIDMFWAEPFSFAYFAHHRYREDFIDLFAGRVYSDQPYRASQALQKLMGSPEKPARPQVELRSKLMSLEQTVETFIKDEIMLGSGPDEIDPAESLIDSGVLDSLALLRLIAFVEEQFGIEIDDDEVLPENFESINAIKSFLATKGYQE